MGDVVLSEPLLHASRPLLDFIEDPLVTKARRTSFGEPYVSCWRSTEAGRFENPYEFGADARSGGSLWVHYFTPLSFGPFCSGTPRGP